MKKAVLAGRSDIEIYGREVIEAVEYDTLGEVAWLPQRIARNFGRPISMNGLWSAILAASGPSDIRADITGDDPHGVGSHSTGRGRWYWPWPRSGAAHRRAGGHRLPADRVALEALRQGLDALAANAAHPVRPLSDGLA